ncbi:MAG: hypothetical protein IH969_10520, partial [Candidatus Krumholzibacteriota bacterium]|nr:hypothetical protein [Candidatus Krumholzibacteriota bacterium]
DGIDGLAAGSAFIASLFLAFISLLVGQPGPAFIYLVVAGASVGFLQFNFPPSRLFMGDSGSTFLGYFFAWMAIAGNKLTPAIPLFIPLLILSSLYLDAGLTLIRRLMRGEKIFQAHHTHYYQRLLSLGLNHKQVTVLEYLITILLGASAIIYLRAGGLFPLFLSFCWLVVFAAAILKIGGLERGDRLFWEKRSLFVIGADIFLIALAYVGAYVLRLNFQFTGAEGEAMLRALPIVLVVRTAVFLKYGLYRGVWKYTSVSDVVRVIKAVTTGSVIILTTVVFLYRFIAFPRTLFIIEYFLLIIFILGARFSMRLFHEIGKEAHGASTVRYGIIGAGDYGELLAREVKSREGSRATVACFIDDDPSKIGLLLHGAAIDGPISRLEEICEKHGVDALILGVRNPGEAGHERIKRWAEVAGVDLLDGPGALDGDREVATRLRRAGRTNSVISRRARESFMNKRVLLTNGGERIGPALAAGFIGLGASVSVQFDNSRELESASAAGRFDDAITWLRQIDGSSAAGNIISSVSPDVVIHCVGLDARADQGTDAYLWRHVVGCTEVLATAALRHGVGTFVLVSFWGALSAHDDGARMAALAEARVLAVESGATRFAALRLPRVLRDTDLSSEHGEAEREYDVTDAEAVASVINVAAETSPAIFVPSWSETIKITRKGHDDGGGAAQVGLPFHTGPAFPAEGTRSCDVEGLRAVTGPLYPADDGLRKVLAGVPTSASVAERAEWMRLVAGRLYHVVSGAPSTGGGGA